MAAANANVQRKRETRRQALAMVGTASWPLVEELTRGRRESRLRGVKSAQNFPVCSPRSTSNRTRVFFHISSFFLPFLATSSFPAGPLCVDFLRRLTWFLSDIPLTLYLYAFPVHHRHPCCCPIISTSL